MKLGVITNGISRDLEYALQAMNKAGTQICGTSVPLGQGGWGPNAGRDPKNKKFGCPISGGGLLCFTTQFRRTSRDGN